MAVCTREAVKSMRERKVDDGHIIHMNRFVQIIIILTHIYTIAYVYQQLIIFIHLFINFYYYCHALQTTYQLHIKIMKDSLVHEK